MDGLLLRFAGRTYFGVGEVFIYMCFNFIIVVVMISDVYIVIMMIIIFVTIYNF